MLQARDVLQHHDGIVQHHADGHHQAAEGEDVERKSRQLHEPEVKDQGGGQGQSHDQDMAPGSQEEIDDQDYQDRGFDGGVAHPVQGGDHVIRLVLHHPQFNAAGQGRLEFLDAALDPPGDIHRVGIRLLEDAQLDARIAAQAGNDAHLFVGIFHLGYIPQIDLPGAAVSQHHAADFVQIAVLTYGPGDELLAGRRSPAPRIARGSPPGGA